MNPALAVVSIADSVSRPDISWMKKHVPILGVARALGLHIQHHKAQCWRVENHRHGDTDPSLSFSGKDNRCRCFVCDMKGGHSNVDLAMHILGYDLSFAVRWIADRFPVPNVKVGRPAENAIVSPMPYRVGVSGSEWEVIVRSGMWGAMTPAERSILATLDAFKDHETGIARLSYRAIMRYSGVRKMGNVSAAIKSLRRMHALRHSPGPFVGRTRECSGYQPTINDPKFLEYCNAVYTSDRQEIAQEREYRAHLKREREKAARSKPVKSLASPATALRIVPQSTTTTGGLCPPVPPAHIPFSDSKQTVQETSTCTGLNLSSPGEVHANKALPRGKREISVSGKSALEKYQRDREYILKRYAPEATP